MQADRRFEQRSMAMLAGLSSSITLVAACFALAAYFASDDYAAAATYADSVAAVGQQP